MDQHLGNCELESSEGQAVDSADVVFIAEGYESGGRNIWLEDQSRCDVQTPEDVLAYLDTIREGHRNLRLILYPDHVTHEAWDLPEHDGTITEAEIRAQSEEWGTDLDWQYIRRIYRSHGWPDAFRQDEAFKKMEKLLNLMEEIGREGWKGQNLL